MLRAIAKLLRPGGRLVFASIFATPGLAATDHRRAIQAGPRAIATRSDHPTMLHQAGLVDVEETDVTNAFLHTAQAWLHHSERLAVQLRISVGAGLFDERQDERRTFIAAIESGLLRRSVFRARRPN